MPYSESIEARINQVTAGWENITSKKMFGGICCLSNGNMFCGVHKDFLILRLGEREAAAALRRPHVRPFDITGRPMKGWVMVAEQGFAQKEQLQTWLEKASAFAATLSPK